MPTFTQRLHQAVQKKDSRICLGVDPRAFGAELTRSGELEIDEYFSAIIEAAEPHIVAVKLQIAFFEAIGLLGPISLHKIMTTARNAGLEVIMDAKRGDIGSTADAYASAYLETGANFASDALTVNPYLGFDTLSPFIHKADEHKHGLFVLVRTSNPGSGEIQDLVLDKPGSPTVAEEIASRLTEVVLAELPLDEHGYSALGAVVGATHPGQVEKFRELMPHSVFLMPGIGAQGGDVNELTPAFDKHGFGAIVNASRSLTYLNAQAEADSLDTVGQVAKEAAARLQDEVNSVLP